MILRRFPIFLAIVVVVVGLPAIAEVYTDWLWFREVGYEPVSYTHLTLPTIYSV